MTTSPTASTAAPCPTLTEATTCLLVSSFILSAVAISLMLPSPEIAPSVKVTLPLASTCACNFWLVIEPAILLFTISSNTTPVLMTGLILESAALLTSIFPACNSTAVAALIVPCTSIVPLALMGIATSFLTPAVLTKSRFATLLYWLNASWVGVKTVKEPALTTPPAPITIPCGLKKYKLPEILLLRIALTVPPISILFWTVFTKVLT